MAREALGITGAIIGGAFFGPVGARVGFAVGSIVGGLIDPPEFEGPSLGDAPVQTSRDGIPIPIMWGRHHCSGNIIQMTPIVESTVKSGSKKTGKVKTTVRKRTFAIGITRGPVGPILGLIRVWENNKLIYDVRIPSTFPAADNAAFLDATTLYLGGEAQLPDPTLEADTGVGSQPAYRGLPYIVFENKDITEFGSSIPAYRFEVEAGIGPDDEGAGGGPCAPAITFYKRNAFNHKVADPEQNSDGTILTYDGGWNATVPDFIADSPNAGWFHLTDIYDTLNDPTVVITNFNESETAVLSGCSVLTWYGNPNGMCDDQIWGWGGSSPIDHEYLLLQYFWVDGLIQACPGKVLGACIVPVGGVDYFYILTNNSDSSDPNPQIGGADDLVYRKATDAANGGTGWTLILTIPYATYSTSVSADPLPYGTAYIDTAGVAWYTKFFPQAAQPYQYALMKVDMVAATHAIFDSNLDTIGTFTTDESATGTGVWTNPGPHVDAHDLDHVESTTNRASGELYMYTMGGTDARYDLYAKLSHALDQAFDMVPDDTGQSIGSGLWVTRSTPQKSWSQDTTIKLVIKKDGVDLREVTIFDYHAYFSSSSRVDFIEDIDPFEWVPTYDYNGISNSGHVFTQRWYIFLHPLTPDEDIYIQKVVTFGLGLNPTTDSIIFGLYRGSTTPELLQQFTGSENDGTNNTWFDAGPTSGEPTALYSHPHSVSTSGSIDWVSGLTTIEAYLDSNYRPQYRVKFDSNILGNCPMTLQVNAGIGFQSNESGHSSELHDSVKGYQHASIRTGGFYLPEFTAMHRAITCRGTGAYAFVLQTIYRNTHWDDSNDAALTNMIKEANMSTPHRFIESAGAHFIVENEGVRIPGNQYKGLYTISHSGENWASGQAYTVDQTVWSSYLTPFPGSGSRIYICILDHTSVAADKPEAGANWATYWVSADMGTHVRSNVLTEDQIKTLSGMTDEDYLPELGITNVTVVAP